MADSNLVKWQGAIDDGINFGKNAYLEAQPDLAVANATAKDVAGIQGAAALGQAQQSQDLANRRVGFNNLEDSYTQEAFEHNSDARKATAGAAISEGVADQFGKVRAQGLRQMQGLGVNPNSGRFAAMTGQLGLGQATAQAAAINKSNTDLDNEANNRQKTAIGFGANLSKDSSAAAQMSGYLGDKAISAASQPLVNDLTYAKGVADIYATGANGYAGLHKGTTISPTDQAAIDAKKDATDTANVGSLVNFAASNAGSSLIEKGISWLTGP